MGVRLGVWLALTAAGLGFVAEFGPRIPLGDDYDVVPVIAGARPLSAGYLWSQLNEHRLPMSRLVLIGLDRLTGHEFRAGMFCSVAASRRWRRS